MLNILMVVNVMPGIHGSATANPNASCTSTQQFKLITTTVSSYNTNDIINNKCVINGAFNDDTNASSSPSITTHLCKLNQSPQPYQYQTI